MKTAVEGFTKKTGIKVEFEQFPFDKYRQTLMLDYTSGKNTWDVNYLSYGWYRSLVESKSLTPLTEAQLAQLNLADVPNMGLYKEKDGNTYFVPYMNEIGGVLYRTDLFEDPKEKEAFKAKYGYELAPPKTLKQYRDIAEFFNRPPNLYGVTLMGKKSIFSVTHFANRLWGLGGTILDSKYKPAFNNEMGIAALQDMKDMFKYANPASLNYEFNDAVNEFIQGKSAMVEIWSTVLLYADNPAQSKIVGKASFTGMPRPEANVGKKLPTLYIAWGLVINGKSPNKDAAFEWIKYVTSKEIEVQTAPAGNIPARFSALEDPGLQGKFKWMKPLAETFRSAELTPIYPWIPEGVTIMGDYLATAVSSFLSGEKSAKDALAEAENKTIDLLTKGGYYK
jgi:multiple sugar transport system substrate-binding protein